MTLHSSPSLYFIIQYITELNPYPTWDGKGYILKFVYDHPEMGIHTAYIHYETMDDFNDYKCLITSLIN